jgi:hypothetical protein
MPNITYGSVEVRPVWDRTSARTRAEQAQASA